MSMNATQINFTNMAWMPCSLMQFEVIVKHVIIIVQKIAPIVASATLDQLSCGVGIWTMQGFENISKQIKHVCESKTNGKVN